jgi:hypothetical protein
MSVRKSFDSTLGQRLRKLVNLPITKPLHDFKLKSRLNDLAYSITRKNPERQKNSSIGVHYPPAL